VAAHLARKEGKSVWDHFHSAISAAVVGNTGYAQSEFEAVASAHVHAPWVAELQAKAAALSNNIISLELLRQAVREEVVKARVLLNLPPLPEDRALWG
jgi:hypothetical protein